MLGEAVVMVGLLLNADGEGNLGVIGVSTGPIGGKSCHGLERWQLTWAGAQVLVSCVRIWNPKVS